MCASLINVPYALIAAGRVHLYNRDEGVETILVEKRHGGLTDVSTRSSVNRLGARS